MLLKTYRHSARRWLTGVLLGVMVLGLLPQALAQPEQQVIITIRNYTFETTQMPLQLFPRLFISRMWMMSDMISGHSYLKEAIHASKPPLRLPMGME